ncbi:MAG TPA: isoprenylcysteine carboxylmethyltransferase family protein [Bryobacteraceae bacterium]|nr:isoprenylcysteine carboxylmethyltransferase family protein [Bryobacteraceae bacterium]
MPLRDRLILRVFLALLMAGAILFVPAGTWRYWQAWVFLVVVFSFPLYTFLYFYKHDRPLLERRLRSREKISEQKSLIRIGKVLFLAISFLPSLDYRLVWSRALLGAVPPWLSLISDALILAGLLLVFWVLRVNSYASRTIEVEAGQKVISSGPYALVRHPMYLGSIVMWLFVPLALGSYVAWPAFALWTPFYVYRLLNEEKFLRQELPGYAEYCLRTHFRLIPYVW